jgi:glutathione S-transferase
LYAFATSPFVHKVAAIMDYKKIPYRAVFVHPQKKAEIQFSQKKQVPIIDDNGTVVEDSTDIALYLEKRTPEPAILPVDAAARDKVMAIEQWFDDVFSGKFYVACRFGTPANRKRTIQAFVDTSPFNAFERVFLPLLSGYLLRDIIRAATENWKHAAEQLDELERKLGKGPFLAEQTRPTIADFAVFAALSVITDLQLEGAAMIRQHKPILEWMDRLRPLTSDGTRLYS